MQSRTQWNDVELQNIWHIHGHFVFIHTLTCSLLVSLCNKHRHSDIPKTIIVLHRHIAGGNYNDSLRWNKHWNTTDLIIQRKIRSWSHAGNMDWGECRAHKIYSKINVLRSKDMTHCILWNTNNHMITPVNPASILLQWINKKHIFYLYISMIPFWY